MSKVLKEYFSKVTSSDIANYGYGAQKDFLSSAYPENGWDWVITNPPFKLAEQFVLQGLRSAKEGVAILARTVFIESVGRYEKIFKHRPPTIYAQFTERVPLIKGRLDKNATTATSYCWLIWEKQITSTSPRLIWIPPCRKRLEKESDYKLPVSTVEDSNFSSATT